MKRFMKKISAALVAAAMLLAAAPALAFSDTAGHWAAAYIDAMAAEGALNGYPDGSFRPDAPVTRAEFAKIITALYGFPVTENGWLAFADTKKDAWYSPYLPSYWMLVDWKLEEACEQYGYPEGWNEDTFSLFDADRPLTRIEAFRGVYTVLGPYDGDVQDEYAALAGGFADSGAFAGNRGIAVLVGAAVKLGLMSGSTDGSFRPYDAITRAEVCALLSRFEEKYSPCNIDEYIAARVEAVDRLAAELDGFMAEDGKTDADKILAAVAGGRSISLAEWNLAYRTYIGPGFDEIEDWQSLPYDNGDAAYAGMTWGQAAEAETLRRLKMMTAVEQLADEAGLDRDLMVRDACIIKYEFLSSRAGYDGSLGDFLAYTGSSAYAVDRYVYDYALIINLLTKLSEPGGPCALSPEELAATGGDDELWATAVTLKLKAFLDEKIADMPGAVLK